MVFGFLPNAYNGSVLYACSNSSTHATDFDKMPTKTNSQNPRLLYSTKLLALKALRHKVECECAKKLAQIDIEIQEEKDARS